MGRRSGILSMKNADAKHVGVDIKMSPTQKTKQTNPQLFETNKFLKESIRHPGVSNEKKLMKLQKPLVTQFLLVCLRYW